MKDEPRYTLTDKAIVLMHEMIEAHTKGEDWVCMPTSWMVYFNGKDEDVGSSAVFTLSVLTRLRPEKEPENPFLTEGPLLITYAPMKKSTLAKECNCLRPDELAGGLEMLQDLGMIHSREIDGTEHWIPDAEKIKQIPPECISP